LGQKKDDPVITDSQHNWTDDMNTSRPAPFTRAAVLAPFHSSSRTSMSENIDLATGRAARVMRTSRLEMRWEAGELRLRCACSTVVLSGERPARRARGAL